MEEYRMRKKGGRRRRKRKSVAGTSTFQSIGLRRIFFHVRLPVSIPCSRPLLIHLPTDIRPGPYLPATFQFRPTNFQCLSLCLQLARVSQSTRPILQSINPATFYYLTFCSFYSRVASWYVSNVDAKQRKGMKAGRNEISNLTIRGHSLPPWGYCTAASSGYTG